MKRRVWVAVISLVVVLMFLLIYFNYNSVEEEITNGVLVWKSEERNLHYEKWSIIYENRTTYSGNK